MKIYLQALKLRNYRNFKDLYLKLNGDLIIVLGDNGSGKTNILEAVSLLSPGTGLRWARNEDIANDQGNEWECHLNLLSKLGSAAVDYSFSKINNLRNIAYNGSKIKTSELPQLADIIWLTPQMEGIFSSSAANRRRFLDRIVYSFHANHASNLNKYTHLTSERLKLLTGRQQADDSWLSILEEKMTKLALKIVTTRNLTIGHLNKAINDLDTPFPKARLTINSLVNVAESTASASLHRENDHFLVTYQKTLYQNRIKDRLTKSTNFGITKQEFLVEHIERQRLAKFCSTGEQKALLISILMGQIEASNAMAKTTPLLLLDEVFVHLDEKRKTFLASYIINSKLQTFITATDLIGIEQISSKAQLVHL